MFTTRAVHFVSAVLLSSTACTSAATTSPSAPAEPERSAEPVTSADPVAAPSPAVITSGAHEHHYFHREEKPHAAPWGYEGDLGPSHWATLDPSYALAASGQSQSPIDIPSSATATAPGFALAYGPSRINLIYNGHTVEEKEDGGSYFTHEGTRYELAQFHFHSPSEHTVDGEHAAMEMHLVHKSAANEVAVVGVFIEPGEAENPAFADVWAYLPDASNRSRTSEQTVDVAAMLPAKKNAYAYEGSFTTPPCTEGVDWVVLTEPVRLSQGQIDTFRAILMGNNRPTQDLHGREVALTRD